MSQMSFILNQSMVHSDTIIWAAYHTSIIEQLLKIMGKSKLISKPKEEISK